MSTIFGTCSMKTGQASMQARQVVQSHSTSSVITSPTIAAAGAARPPDAAAVVRAASLGLPSELRAALEQVMLQVEDQVLRRERLAG